MGIPRKTRRITNKNTSFNACVRRHEEKRVGKLVHRSTPTVRSLPRDLLLDVLGRVASSSFDDLFNAKLSCKDFLESTKDDYILEHISIEKFPLIHWITPSKRVLSFLTHCFEKENPESLFRQGMIGYFNLVNVESGLEYLKRAAERGHFEATYVYGMILLSRGGQWSQQGLNLLNSMNHSRSRNWNVQKCRDKVGSILSQMWINNPITLEEVNTSCRKRDHVVRLERRGWSLDEEDEISRCDMCLWYRELVCFCKIMNVSV